MVTFQYFPDICLFLPLPRLLYNLECFHINQPPFISFISYKITHHIPDFHIQLSIDEPANRLYIFDSNLQMSPTIRFIDIHFARFPYIQVVLLVLQDLVFPIFFVPELMVIA